jgi:hypothetical protein
VACRAADHEGVAGRSRELGGEACLADPGLAAYEHDAAFATARPIEPRRQPLDLRRAADEAAPSRHGRSLSTAWDPRTAMRQPKYGKAAVPHGQGGT